MSKEAISTLESIYVDISKNQYNPINLRFLKTELINSAHTELVNWKPIKNELSNNSSPFQVLDFFCGCGGMSLGFSAVSNVIPSFELIGGCDIDPDAAKTFSHNFGSPAIIEDIRKLANDESNLENTLSLFPLLDRRKPLILIGCAPCQGFTSHRKKNWDNEDERNSLVLNFAIIAAKINPACVIMENVPEMLSQKYWTHFEAAKNILEKAGYILHQTIYNSASFGVPQERFRTLVIAMKKEFILPEPLIKDPSDFLTVRNAIGDLPSLEAGKSCPNDKYHLSANHRKSTIDTIKSIPKDGGSRPPGVGPKCLDNIKGYYDVYGRLSWDKPSITITHYARNPASGRFVHPEQNRGLTIREAALLQSFPKGFEFSGSFDSIFKQIGEAVPPKFACAVAVNVLIELISSPPTEKEISMGTSSTVTPVNSSYSSVIAGIKMKRGKK